MYQNMKLGRLPHDPERYATVPHLFDHVNIASVLPLIADSCDYKKKMPNPGGMLGNDRYGDCAFASFGHLTQSICANLNIPCKVTEGVSLGWYGECTGWKASDPSTDNGVVLIDAMKYFMAKGLILGYARVNMNDPAHVAAGLELCGGLYIGLDMPVAWQGTQTWGVGPNKIGDWTPGGWGGHCVGLHTYDPATNTQIDTWDSWVIGTVEARPVYCPEGYGLILPQWFNAQGKTMQGLDLAGLQAALTLVK